MLKERRGAARLQCCGSGKVCAKIVVARRFEERNGEKAGLYIELELEGEHFEFLTS